MERHPDPSDRRAELIVPTARGLDQGERSAAIVAAIEERAAVTVGEAAYASLNSLLREVAGGVSGAGLPWRDERRGVAGGVSGAG